jgi:hypothetical protein
MKDLGASRLSFAPRTVRPTVCGTMSDGIWEECIREKKVSDTLKIKRKEN